MGTTVKAFDTVDVTPAELFSMSYKTREMYTDTEIETLKRTRANAEFFEKDGIIFFVSHDEDVKVLDYLKDYRIKPHGNLWKFGFVDADNGNIVMLFGGKFMAKGRDVAKFYKIADTLTKMRFAKKTKNRLVAFAFRD